MDALTEKLRWFFLRRSLSDLERAIANKNLSSIAIAKHQFYNLIEQAESVTESHIQHWMVIEKTDHLGLINLTDNETVHRYILKSYLNSRQISALDYLQECDKKHRELVLSVIAS